MKNLTILLLAALLLTLTGCGEKAVDNKVGAEVSVQVELTPEEKFAETKRKAEAGDAVAQFELAKMYHNGRGIPIDIVKSVDWLQKAALQGEVMAQTLLGWVYRSGEGVPKDAAKAVEWYQKAAAQGDAAAQSGLGEMYRNGEGVTKDAAKAVQWYWKVAAKGGFGSAIQSRRDVCQWRGCTDR
ncbi:MAG: tetratricopeptide repeat protein [Candidatus Nitrotoga sp.]